MWGWLRGFFAADSISEDEEMARKCRDILDNPKAHPMERYWAAIRLPEAEARVAATRAREADQAAEAHARASMRPSARPCAASPHDPGFRQAKGAPPPVKPTTLGHVMPPMPWEMPRR